MPISTSCCRFTAHYGFRQASDKTSSGKVHGEEPMTGMRHATWVGGCIGLPEGTPQLFAYPVAIAGLVVSPEQQISGAVQVGSIQPVAVVRQSPPVYLVDACIHPPSV